MNANIITHQLALGSAENIANMYVSSNQKQSSSLLKPKDHLVCHSDVQFLGLEEVKVDLLDNFNYTGYNFLAMDVQGYELEVLKGARKTLEYVDYVYAEVNRAEVYEGNAFVEDLDNFLTEYNMKRVETVWPGGIWGDALYIRT
ncbi:FkbM family methyltransferase [bacterium]|nr:FkbM family methyltransferase [bacterium]